jgi:hypothetical protein
VPNPQDSQDIKKRAEQLESSLNATRESVSLLQQRLSDHRLDVEGNRVTRAALISVTVFLVCTMLTGATFFYQRVLPAEIDRSISENARLTVRLDNIDRRFEDINISLNELRSDIKSLADAKFLSAALKDATSGNEADLVKRLPDAKRLLHQVRSMRVILAAKDYQDLSKPLLHHYSSAKPPLKGQLWETLVSLANAKSNTDAIVHPLSQTDIDKARSEGKYFEAAEVDLSTARLWKDVIFRACKIKITKPEQELVLKDVRFVECDFNSMAENESSRRLLDSFLSKDSPKVSETLARFQVLLPVYKAEK